MTARASASSRPPDHSSPSVRLRAVYQIRKRAYATWPGNWSFSRQRSWDFDPSQPCSGQTVDCVSATAAHMPFLERPRCRFGQWIEAPRTIGKGARRSRAIRRGFWVFRLASRACHGLAGRCCLGLLLFQVFGRTVARRPGLVTLAGHRPVGFCFQSLTLVSLIGVLAPSALQRIRQASAWISPDFCLSDCLPA